MAFAALVPLMHHAIADSPTPTQATPTVHDERLQLTLVAEDPVVRTPIGLAIDDADRLYVLESHTHSPPDDYDGPNRDRVLRFEDADNDGRYEDVTEFANGINMGMNLAFDPDGVLHVVSAKDVLALPDNNDDGVCDGNELIVRIKTGSNYPHNCLLGITFDRDGWMYLARGNVGSTPYEFEGPDGSRVEGYGDGGSIVRCRGDGTEIEEFATGFWNPIQLKFDRAGRLLCVDNDPDARGPNRLIHVVRGGDYGHRNMYGGSGNHPFQGWDGDLPGTLPYVSGTGEAPCDLLDATRTSFPASFNDSILVTVWNENTIERHRIHEDGLSIRGEGTRLVQGDDNFRPVAIEANSKGDVFFTDWVRVDYPNHGRGRLWRLSANSNSNAMKPAPTFAEPHPSSGQARALGIANFDSITSTFSHLQSALKSNDAFERHTATMPLANRKHRRLIEAFATDKHPRIRLAALLASSRCAGPRSEWQMAILRRMLGDETRIVRQAALIDVGTNRLASLRPDIDRSIETGSVDEALFETYLACVECLDPKFIAAYDSRQDGSAKKAPRRLEPKLLLGIVSDSERPPAIRVLALNRMVTPLSEPARSIVNEWLGSANTKLRIAAINRLADDPNAMPALLTIARDFGLPTNVRCEALLAVQKSPNVDPIDLCPLIDDPVAAVASRAARTLKEFAANADVQSFARSRIERASSQSIRQCLAMILAKPNSDRPDSLAGWQAILAAGGDTQAGHRVFRSRSATCQNCHQIVGHETTLGPNLGQIAQSVDRQQIIRSILRPSDQFAPQYQAWTILTDDGQVHVGLQIDHQAGGNIDLILTSGRKHRFHADTIEEYAASTTSIMPSGLEQKLTITELRDLVAYLASLR